MLTACLFIVFSGVSPADQAADLLTESGITGGLVVHLGCGDGQLTAALHASDSFVVHGLDRQPHNVARAREHIRALGLYGKVSVAQWTADTLPYADNLVRLMVIEDPGNVREDEVTRVLAPGGVALWREAQGRSPMGWRKTVKPWPDTIDEWTHDLHDAGGNAVAHDSVVGPPKYLQWTAGPLWARSHGYTPSVSAMVSAKGRWFAIVDETLTGADTSVPSNWQLVARDAFSGVLLWKKPMLNWGSAALNGLPDTGGGVSVGRFTMPPQVGKRLVAVGDTVYVTLGAEAPVTALDAASGSVRHVYADTARADEVLVSGDRLIAAINPPASARPPVAEKTESPAPPPAKEVCVVDLVTGKTLWRKGSFVGVRMTRGQDPFGRLELAAGDGKVFALTTESVECLAVDTGQSLWRIPRPALSANAVRKLGYSGIYEYLLTDLVYAKDTLLLAQPEPNVPHTYHTMPGSLYAFDAGDGRQLWKHAYGAWGHGTPPDVFVIDDNVWTHVHTEPEFSPAPIGGVRAKDPSTVPYRIQALDLRTGALRKELPARDIFNVGHHHRCYRNKTTDRFLMASRRGVEFIDLQTGENWQNHWVRSGCLLGNMPCNGLVYVAPHPCQCYIAAKLVGFNALSANRATPERSTPAATRLTRGPAYGATSATTPTTPNDSWPTYRHDGKRSGSTEAAVSEQLAPVWRAQVGTTPSAVTVADEKVYVAGVDAHTVHALETATGKELWQFTAQARVDSPPTVEGGRVLFGSADGHVYCLRAADGALQWRFQAAPEQRFVSAFNQLESAWPVPGSVLLHDGKCWFAAGRSSYLDGGIRFFALDPATGEVVSDKVLYSPDPKTGKQPPSSSPNSLPGVLRDIPSTDGQDIFLRQLNVTTADGDGKPHLFTTGGFLDDSWFNRTSWKYGRARTSGLMVLGADAAYGMELYGSRSREAVFAPGHHAYRLVCRPFKPAAASRNKDAKRKQGLPMSRWEQRLEMRVTALVRAGDKLFAGGSPDVLDPNDPAAAWEGRRGGRLAVFSTAEGKKLAEYELPAPPVWDGMAVTAGRLYLALSNGEVVLYRQAP